MHRSTMQSKVPRAKALAALALVVFVAAVTLSTAQAVFAADECYCPPCWISEGESEITTSVYPGGGCGYGSCLVTFTKCYGNQCRYDGCECRAYPSGSCSDLLCDAK